MLQRQKYMYKKYTSHKPTHTTRVHGPSSRVSKMTPVFTGREHG